MKNSRVLVNRKAALQKSVKTRQIFEKGIPEIRWKGDQGTGRCPFHTDRRPSFSIDAKNGLFFCHGCGARGNAPQFERRMIQSQKKNHALVSRAETNEMSKIQDKYPYEDEEGKLLFEQLRLKPKAFRSRRPTDDGGWIYKLQGVRRVPYRLPEVFAAEEVFVAEGEKDVESLRAWGLVATCNPGGAGKWRDEYSRLLNGKKVVVLQDDDEPGRKHAQAVAESVARYAAEVRIIPPFPKAKDVTEWVERGGTKRKLQKMVASTAPIERGQATVIPAVEGQTLSPDDWRARPLRGAWTVRLAESLFRDYLILPTGVSFVASLWEIGTYVFEEFDCFPYLTVTSPTKRCGKTRFGEILELLCCRSMMSVNTTEAALFRTIDSEKPTVIIDEAEALRNKSSERAQYLLSILQAGFRQGAVVPRCVGSAHEVEKFSVYSPKAILAIGNLPDTLMDRSIVVSMRRHLPSEHVARFRRRFASQQAAGIVSAIAAWVDAHKEQISRAYLKQNLDFLKDRESDIWEPLFAIAAVAVPERLEELKRIATRLSDEKASMDVDDSQGLQLLADIRTTFGATKHNAIPSADLVDRLKRDAANHWSEEFSQTKLARLLRPFGISPQQLWLNERNFRGYRHEDFKSAFERYLPAETR